MPPKIWILSSVMSTKPLIIILSQSFMPKITQNSSIFPQDKPWRLSDPVRQSSDSSRKVCHDHQLHLFSHWVPHSFLVCSVFKRRPTDPPESHEGQGEENQQRVWSHIPQKIKILPLEESLSPRVRLGCVLLCSEWHRRELQGELSTLWAAAGPGCWASEYLIHSVAQSMVFCLSVSGWCKTHTNDERMRIRSEYSPYPTLISEFSNRI